MRAIKHHLPMICVAAGLFLGLSAGGFLSAAEAPKGAVLHFDFNKEDPAGNIPDGSGHNNSGKATGAKWTGSAKKGGGYELNPTNSCIRIAHSPSLTLKQGTFSTWFKVTRSDANCRRILNRGKDGAFSMTVGGEPDDSNAQGKVTIRFGDRQIIAGDKNVADGLWHNAAVVFDGKDLKLFVDGELQKKAVPCTGNDVPGSGDFTIGMFRPGGPADPGTQSLEGAVDEVMVFNRALAQDEIKALVYSVDPNPGKARFTKQQVAGRLRQLKLLYEEGLLTQEFYDEKVRECETSQ